MASLAPELRRLLEKAIVQARVVAEEGASAALESLAVHYHEPHGSMSDDQRQLRRRLREHGRQLGDMRDSQGAQSIRRLLREVAYEHWHRMLFARFLAENGLLIEPGHGVAVSLEEVEELARERGSELWPLAAQFAQRMLPQLFRGDDPSLQVALPPEKRLTLEQLLRGLPAELFVADDALGWTYQFWQSAEKAAVNARAKSGQKIDGESLPAVTQLFTEPYMVQFLLHNTLGAWHAGKVLAARPELATTATSEPELRAAVALPGVAFDYLRFVREGAGEGNGAPPDAPWRPAAGVFATWPRVARELKVLDPCCGSGHFLVAAFDLLVTLRQHEERLAAADAVRAVLRDNLCGLELDARCTQIAAFALALAAWKRAGAAIELPALQIACCGLGPSGTKAQWLERAERAAGSGSSRGQLHGSTGGVTPANRNAMAALYDLFQQAPDLGSLIDPRGLDAILQVDFASITPLFAKALQSEAADDAEREQAVVAQGMAKAAELLGRRFTLVITNVPYLGRGQHGDVLREFAEKRWPEAKADLATLFVQRSFGWLGTGGTAAFVTPQNWLFLTRYRKLRERLLRGQTWEVVARLGPKGFQTPMWDFNILLSVLSAIPPDSRSVFMGIDVAGARTPAAKAAQLRGDEPPLTVGTDGPAASPADLDAEALAEADPDESPSDTADGTVKLIPQAEQLKNPDAAIRLKPVGSNRLLGESAMVRGGTTTGDSSRFRRAFWEPPATGLGESARWALQQGTLTDRATFGGRSFCLEWEQGHGLLALHSSEIGATVAGREVWGRDGLAISYTGACTCTRYTGQVFENVICVAVPRDPQDLGAIWSFAQSPQFSVAVRSTNQKLSVDVRYFEKTELDLLRWRSAATESYPAGLPEPQSNDPTQWLFHGHPAGMVAAGPATASPFGIADSIGADRHASLICRTPNVADVLQVATARLLGYRWPAELDPKMRLDVAQRAWVEQSAELARFADEDGIVCLAPTHGERSAADRLRDLLARALGPAWSTATERRLLDAVADGTPAATLEEWLRDHFFAAHCKRFHDRPFVWHLWDGRKDGFHAFVNYHRLAGAAGEGRRTLELLAFTYLNDWIERQSADAKAGTEGSEGRLAAALLVQQELKRVLDGEPPCDLFIRWKPLHEQPLGWSPDLNDGVRLNLRPFLRAADVKTKGAGLLRARVGVHWNKDRGNDPETLRPRDDFPWFWSCDPEIPSQRTDYLAPKGANFDGIRWNDLHYSRAAKEAARKRQRERPQ